MPAHVPAASSRHSGRELPGKPRHHYHTQMFELSIRPYLQKHGFERLTPKAVLFDMDGVLYDSMPNHAQCWQESMAEFGIHMTADDAYAYEGMRGVETIKIMVRQQQGREISEDEAQKMYDEKTRLFGLLPKAPIMPGIIDLMSRIKESGVRICVVTGSGQRPLLRRLVNDFGDFIDADHIVSAYDVKRGKPQPDPYLKGMAKTGCTHPWEAIVVENAPLGVQAGAAADIFTVAVNSGPLPDETLASSGADIVLPRMTVLADEWSSLLSEVRAI